MAGMAAALKHLTGPLLMGAAWVLLWLVPERTLALYFCCMAAAWVGFGLAWRDSKNWSTRTLAVALWSGAIAWRVCGLVSKPVFENDWARFLWDGWLTVNGHDPFQSVPMDWFSHTDLPVAMSHVLDQVNHPQLHTVYGPFTQAMFAVAAWFCPGSLVVFKTVLATADLAIVAVLQRKLGARRALLYAWCPLVIQETAFSAHPDVLALALMVLAWFSDGRPIRAGFFMALALAARPQAMLLMPFILWRGHWKSAASFVTTLTVCYATYLREGHFAEWSHLSQMSGDWHFNDVLLTSFTVVLAEPAARFLCLVIFLGTAIILFIRWARGSKNDPPPLALLYAVWWLCSPVANAWYLQFAVPWLVTKRSRLAWGLLLAAPLSYAHGLQLASGIAAWELAWWVIPVEGMVAIAALAWVTVERRR
jgi:alpha-1,6-mannosyltransferase